ncbi:DNA repair protein RadA [Actinomycetospora sp. NBRC 106375]|uniref:DNA repair protein RadA n=1 Tax=Actinomycetospora sp. NBRC 106375 TaxID=3032207 RepID=UPI0024A23CDC|nr:DNA repair protein RadA [Actinomycetospora sp. NBRC 106375]GLZ48682.1 DNA repair protein RadA [Actinomycetospora sp. NBRC 106375]
MPSRARASRFECTACGHAAAKWVGRCPDCGGWGTVEESPDLPSAGRTGRPGVAPAPAARPSSPVRLIGEVGLETAKARPTGVAELDRVLGGGLVPGVVVLLAGEPGVGKSTLLLEVAAQRARAGATVLYVTGEESAGQVRLRAERTGGLAPHLFLSATGDLEEVAAHVEAVDPELLVVDSVQTVGTATAEGSPGGVSQVRTVTSALVALAKQRDLPVVLIGHVTKDGAVAGPRTLEHLVDVVLSFEGDRHSTLRMVRGLKNRFGATDEVGCFEMNDGGITEVTDPSGLFTGGLERTVAGQAVTVAMEGKRPLMAEVQALVATRANDTPPRRVVSDLDSGRVAKILAVLQERCGLRLHDKDVFVATVGGMKLREPSADLAVAIAVTSAFHNQPVRSGLVAIGEVGLGGELRRVVALERRLAEAGRLGISRAIVPPGDARTPKGLTAAVADDLHGALMRTGLVGVDADFSPQG